MKPPQAESPTVLLGDSLMPLESVLCTEELNRRPSRPPDYEKENRVLVALAEALADSPSTILQKMTEIMLETFRAGSSGFSLLTKDDGGKRFYWPAISGVWKPHIGGGTPRDFGPCGDVLDRNAPLLFRHFERRYTYFLPVTPPVEECLLVPFYIEGKAVGTIWVIAHDDRREFDAEDLRQLVSLGKFASSAYQTVAFHEKTLAINEALMLGSLRQHELTEVADSLNVQLQSEIAERKQAEQRQHFLMNELAHRGNNLLAVIQSIASLSLSGTRSLAEARDVLTQRIQALARSQSVLVTQDFVGAPVAEIIRLEFEGFSDRVKAVGPDVMLNPRVAQTFALMVHELATNAAKYGALSAPGGQVAIHWSIEGAGAEARFKFQWQERDGPPVAPPTYKGFGRIVLEKAVALDFGEEPTIKFEPQGLSYEIGARLSVVAVGSAGGAEGSF